MAIKVESFKYNNPNTCNHENSWHFGGNPKGFDCYDCNSRIFYEETVNIVRIENLDNLQKKSKDIIRRGSNRNHGYYWLRTEDSLHIGEWNGFHWHLIDTELHYDDNDFSEINENQIETDVNLYTWDVEELINTINK